MPHHPRSLPRPLLGAACCLLLLGPPARALDDGGIVLRVLRPGLALVAEPAALDLGDVLQGEILTRTVTFTNRGEGPYPVQRVSTTCGCTLARVLGPDGAPLAISSAPDAPPLLILQPGQALVVEVEFLPANQRGAVLKSVRVMPADPALPVSAVPLRAHVRRVLAVDPAVLDLGRVPRSGRVEVQVYLESSDLGEWGVASFGPTRPQRPLPAFLHLAMLDETGPRRRLRLWLDEDRSVGPLNAAVRIAIQHERVSFVDFLVTGRVEPAVRFRSDAGTYPVVLRFDAVPADGSVTRTLSIQNIDPSVPYLLLTAEVQGETAGQVTAQVRTLEEGLRYEVDLTATGPLPGRFFRGQLLLRATHPDLAERAVPFFGWTGSGQR